MKKFTRVLFVVAVAGSAGALQAQDMDAAVQRGQAKFEHSCEPCHGRGPGDDGRAMLPGTQSLQLKYQGSIPAALQDRSDLTAEALRVFVRQGVWAMPPFRKTELSDAEIDDIAAYLQYSSRQAGAGAQ
jgi:mono/diheme cytochrome c family protein